MSTRRESDVAISDGAGARGAGTVRSDLALGVRLATGGGPGTWFRLILSAIGIGLCATVLLLAASFGPALDSRQMRIDGVTPHYLAQFSTGTDGEPTAADLGVPGRFEAHQSEIAYRGKPVRGTDLAALPGNVSAIPAPPGVARVPAPGQLVLSPALAGLLATADGADLSQRLSGEVIGSIDPAGLVDPGELRFYRGAQPISGWWADNALADGWGVGDGSSAYPQPSAPYVPVLLTAGTVIVLTPLFIFISLLSRLGGPGRDRRSATIRLLGASTLQLQRITLVETGLAAMAGLVLGALGFAIARHWAPSISIGSGAFFPSDITPLPAAVIGLVVIVPLLALTAVWWGSRRVVTDPLGVARNAQSRSPRPWKGLVLLIFGAVAMVGSMVTGVLAGQSDGVVLMSVAVVALLLSVLVLLPWALGVVVGRLPATGVAWQLAVRRLQLDSSTPARAVAGVCVVLAGAIALQPLITLLSADRTGSSSSGALPPAYRVYVMDSRNIGELSEVIDVLATADGVDAVVGGIPIGGRVGELRPPNPDGSLNLTGSFGVTVATCAAIPEAPDCRDGQVFAVQQPVNVYSDWNSVTLGMLSHGGAVSLYGNAEQAVTVSLPPLTRTIQPDPSRYQDGQASLLITPGALGADGDQLVAGIGMDLRVVAEDPSSATADHIRTELADLTWRPSVITTAESTGDRGQFTTTARAALLVAALLTLLVAAVGVLVMTIEQLIDRRRALTFSIASGVPRRMIARSVVIGGIIPILVGVALAAVIGSVLSAFLFALVGQGWQVNWAMLAASSATAVLLVGLSCVAALPLLTVLTRPEAIRTG